MKKICLFVFFVVLLLTALSLPVLAQEEAKYNFASAQGDKELKIKPGTEGSGYIYFYNIDGNRITHISLEAKQYPEGWQVSIDPPVADTQVLVSGNPVTVRENLYVEPSDLLDAEPTDVPKGMISIKVPGRGYALGKMARIFIELPESIPLGSTGGIVIAAEAAWLGQSGAAAVKQARDFEFSVTAVSGQTGYTEEIIGEEKLSLAAPESTGAEKNTGSLTPVSGKPTGFSLKDWTLWVIIAVAILLIIVITILVRRRRD